MKNKTQKKLISAILVLIFVFGTLPLGAFAKEETQPEVTVVEEDTSKRGMFEKHFLCSDGSYIAQSYAESIHYLDENGKWQDVDNTISYDTASGSYITANKSFPVSFNSGNNKSSLINISKNNTSLQWTLKVVKSKKTDASVTASVKDASIKVKNNEMPSNRSMSVKDSDTFALPKTQSSISYKNLFGADEATEVRYSVFQDRVEEDVIFNEKTDVEQIVMNFTNCPYKAVVNEFNIVSFVDENGEVCYNIGTPYLEDSGDNLTEKIKISIEQNGKDCRVIYSLDTEWLNSENCVYPVLFDPSVTTANYMSGVIDGYTIQGESSDYSTVDRLRFGCKNYSPVSGLTILSKYHGYIKFYIPPIDTSTYYVTNAYINFRMVSANSGYDFDVYQVDTAWRTTSEGGTIGDGSEPYLRGYNEPTRGSLVSEVEFQPGKLNYCINVWNGTLKSWCSGAQNNGYMICYKGDVAGNNGVDDFTGIVNDINSFYSSDTTSTSYCPVMTVVYETLDSIRKVAATVFGEVGGVGYGDEAKYAVSCVIRNRVLSSTFPNSYYSVISASGQFDAFENGNEYSIAYTYYTTGSYPSLTTKAQMDTVLDYVCGMLYDLSWPYPDITYGSLYFCDKSSEASMIAEGHTKVLETTSANRMCFFVQ